MVRRSALDAIGGFDESLPSCQDLDLWLRISERFDADVVPEVLVRVANGNDNGRITTNVPRAILGRELYCRKHREKMIRRGVLHLFLRDSGWWQQRRVRDSRLARRFYLESLAANPGCAVYLRSAACRRTCRCRGWTAWLEANDSWPGSWGLGLKCTFAESD